MDDCKHVKQVKLAVDKSFLNPRNWNCCECGTTESVWACLLCSHVACGRSCEEHALKHFHLSKHPLSIEVNLRYVYCYLCDDYILNDNSMGDIRLAQSMLSQVASQHYQESCTRSGRIIKPAAQLLLRGESRMEEVISYKADKRYTALCHWRFLQLFRAFNTWREYVALSKQMQESSVPIPTPSLQPPPPPPPKRSLKRKSLLTPGMTGLRNLGNTCYMNAILQSLGHLSFFRESFRQLGVQQSSQQLLQSSTDGCCSTAVPFNRQTTIECFERLQSCPAKRPRLRRQTHGAATEGLMGGARKGGGRSKRVREKEEAVEPEETTLLSQAVHSLLRVMWSGKWAVVTPHAVLNAVWRLVPAFRGYSQQDAQEFLCEALEKLQSELSLWPPDLILRLTHPCSNIAVPSKILPSLFEGQLTSLVTHRTCRHLSRKVESFCDLSLDFPAIYQGDVRKPQQKNQQLQSCYLYELLQKFTENEILPEEIFCCSQCSSEGKCGVRPQSVEKRLSILHPPDVLRLHLKRFRWSGRVRHKISTHVKFPMTFDLYPYHTPPPELDPSEVIDVASYPQLEPADFLYDLASVVEHHGAGLTSGHYTAYCWNTDADSWIHCNDNRIRRCPGNEVAMVQAYILFYARQRGCSPVLKANSINYDNVTATSHPPARGCS